MAKRQLENSEPENKARILVEEDGHVYGSWPVLLYRDLEVMIGTRMGRYGGVSVDIYEGKRFVEEPDIWWNNRNWHIVEPAIPIIFNKKEKN